MPDIPNLLDEEPMVSLCRFVTETSFERLPAAVVTQAKHSILDTLAVMAGGSAMEGIEAVVDLVKDRGGKQESRLLFHGGTVPASEAALAMGPMARAMDFGDTHVAGHVTEYILPTMLAVLGLRDKVSGKDFITALALGQEVLLRIGVAYDISRSVIYGDAGGHFTFGAVAAVGKLLGLSQEELENAQGIAKALLHHDMAMYLAGTLMVRVHHGLVCQNAVNACLLAQRGITGPRQQVLTGRCGLLSGARWETHPELLVEDLGDRWEMLDILRKSHTACHCTHTAIDGIMEQMAVHAFDPADIAAIHIEESTLNYAVVAEPKEGKWNPQSVAECQFSLPYVVATAAYEGEIFLDAYSPQARTREDVRELMTRISASEDPALPWLAARVITTLRDGRVLSSEQFYPRGHPKNPVSEQDLVAKLYKCLPYAACTISAATADAIVRDCLNLEQIADVESALVNPLAPNGN